MRMINTALIFLGLVSSATLTSFSVGDFAATGPIFAEETEMFAFEGSTSAVLFMVLCTLFMHQ